MEEKPKSVRVDLWERFKKLERRTDELARKSKFKLERYNKKKRKIEDEVTVQTAEESPAAESDGEKKKEDPNTQSTSPMKEGDSNVKEWQDLKPYLNINSHLQQLPASSSAPKSGLEKKINEAISLGDVETATSLSDSLATREFGTKIAASFDAREYLKRKKEEEMTAKAKKKKKLHWGFEHKQRWEMKGNM